MTDVRMCQKTDRSPGPGQRRYQPILPSSHPRHTTCSGSMLMQQTYPAVRSNRRLVALVGWVGWLGSEMVPTNTHKQSCHFTTCEMVVQRVGRGVWVLMGVERACWYDRENDRVCSSESTMKMCAKRV